MVIECAKHYFELILKLTCKYIGLSRARLSAFDIHDLSIDSIVNIVFYSANVHIYELVITAEVLHIYIKCVLRPEAEVEN